MLSRRECFLYKDFAEQLEKLTCLADTETRPPGVREGIEPGFCVLKQKMNVICLLWRMNATFHICRIDIVILNSTKTATLNVKLLLPTR